ncbi:chromophore lyase CpcT/CpeT [Anthocerotibacter panamensis]|uniref:chromophore lyase CpcT/CpeT n=1 Tax=Anthocerotibacter panamensis TaxID=2857077 RepID=UPI001C40891C|nr:chromophore lyase CpcT/CpeT [Anthocerotibacter panamensis]
MNPSAVLTLARWMAGDFSNRVQAFREPAFFSQIRVCHRPLPYDLFKGISFYVEQAYDVFLDTPYRVRVLHFVPQEDAVLIENYVLNDPQPFIGAAREPHRLQQLTRDNLEQLVGCSMILREMNGVFCGSIEPGKGCKVVRKGQDSYLVSEVEVHNGKFFSYDRGFDPNTDQQLWGSYAGRFEFDQWSDFSLEVPSFL